MGLDLVRFPCPRCFDLSIVGDVWCQSAAICVFVHLYLCICIWVFVFGVFVFVYLYMLICICKIVFEIAEVWELRSPSAAICDLYLRLRQPLPLLRTCPNSSKFIPKQKSFLPIQDWPWQPSNDRWSDLEISTKSIDCLPSSAAKPCSWIFFKRVNSFIR